MLKKLRKLMVIGAMGLLFAGFGMTVNATSFSISGYSVTDEGYFYKVLEDGTAEIRGSTSCIEGRSHPQYCPCGGKFHRIKHLDIPSTISVDGKKYIVTSIGAHGFSGCELLTSVTIPDTVTSIGTQAFDSCTSLESIVIPDSVTNIDYSAFLYCKNLKTVTLPDGLTAIESALFGGCESLVSIKIPDTVTEIWHLAFKDCKSLSSITIPNGITTIDEWTFSGCDSLTSVIIPDSVTTIYHSAFKNCKNLSSVVLSKSLTSIHKNAFANCESLTSVTIPEGMDCMIDDSTFKNCDNLTITYPDSVPHFEDKAKRIYIENGMRYKIVSSKTVSFLGLTEETAAKTKKLAIPDTVTIPSKDKTYKVEYIAENALKGNTSIRNVTIGKNMKIIKKGAFRGCKQLKKVTIKSKKLQFVGKNALKGTKSNIRIKVPKKKLEAYQRMFKYIPGLGKKAKIV